MCVPHVYRTCIMVYGLQGMKVKRHGITDESLSAQACTFLLALQAQPIHTSAHNLHTYLQVRAISAVLSPMLCTAPEITPAPQPLPHLPAGTRRIRCPALHLEVACGEVGKVDGTRWVVLRSCIAGVGTQV